VTRTEHGAVQGTARYAAEIDTAVPHPARIYDYLLGGTTNFAVDREAAERASAVVGMENACADVRANRAFLERAVRYLAGEAGVRQFVDIGTGIPNADQVHAVAQKVAPDARIVYVDHDPIVVAHAHELLKSTSEGTTAFVLADLREPEVILERAAETLDFAKPVAVMLVAVLHFFADEGDPYGLVKQLLHAVPSGSYLTVSHLTGDFAPDAMTKVVEQLNRSTSEPFVLRPRTKIVRFFDGLDLVEPGLVQVDEWRPDPDTSAPASKWQPCFYGAVGRKQ
jgi:S-adenosyl methyltransferase